MELQSDVRRRLLRWSAVALQLAGKAMATKIHCDTLEIPARFEEIPDTKMMTVFSQLDHSIWMILVLSGMISWLVSFN